MIAETINKVFSKFSKAKNVRGLSISKRVRILETGGEGRI